MPTDTIQSSARLSEPDQVSAVHVASDAFKQAVLYGLEEITLGKTVDLRTAKKRLGLELESP